MDCDSIRAAISAGLDGEDPGVPDGGVEAHLAGCPACRAWQERAHAVTRRIRLGGYALDHDLAPRVVAALPAPRRQRRAVVQRAGLLAAALAQLAITVPLLVYGHDHDAGVHAARELGSFDLALGIAFAVGALRPALSAGLAWPCGIAALGLAGTAIAGLIAGQTVGADEALHLVAVTGAALLSWQARTLSGQPAGQAAAALPASSVAGPGWMADRLDQLPELAARPQPPYPGPGAARAQLGTARAGGQQHQAARRGDVA